MENIKQLTLGQIVTRDYKASLVFQKYGIDFCCMGGRNLVDACKSQNVDPDQIIQEIDRLENKLSEDIDFNQWSLDTLADYIFQNHHAYIEKVTPTIKIFLDKICNVHGERHPELFEIRHIFYKSSGELAVHMKKEELLIFPFIKKLIKSQSDGNQPESKAFNTIASPVAEMQDEHLDEGEQLQRMAKISNNYTVPPDACVTFETTYKMLREYEQDMHKHIHLENNILFPKAILLEEKLLKGNTQKIPVKHNT